MEESRRSKYSSYSSSTSNSSDSGNSYSYTDETESSTSSTRSDTSMERHNNNDLAILGLYDDENDSDIEREIRGSTDEITVPLTVCVFIMIR